MSKNTKVAIISDIHFGVNKNSELFLNSCLNFFNNEFVPYLEKSKINTILILGDIFDNRNSINVKITDEVYNLFSNTLKKFKVYILVGNHDTYYKTTNDVHSLKFLNHLSNVTVIDTIRYIEICGINTLFCPWIYDYNDVSIMSNFNNPSADVLFGHFDIVGFALNRTRISTHGMNFETFSSFKKVFSGHYHTPSSKRFGNTEIVYIGSPYQMNRNDKLEAKGFIELDLSTLTYKRVINNVSLKFIDVVYPNIPDIEDIEGNIVDAIVTIDKNDVVGNVIDKYVEKIENMKPAEKVNIVLNIVNNNVNSDFDDIKTKITSIKDLIELYITKDNNISNKSEIQKLILDIYEEVK